MDAPGGERRVEADAFEERGDSARALGAAGQAVDAQRIVERARDGRTRVERGQRILENHLEASAQLAQRLALRSGEIDTVEADLSAVRLDEAHDDACER